MVRSPGSRVLGDPPAAVHEALRSKEGSHPEKKGKKLGLAPASHGGGQGKS